MYSKWFTAEGASEALNAIQQELQEQGELSESFLSKLVTNEGSTGGTYYGNQQDLETLLSILFSDEYEIPWIYAGSFANKYTSKYVQGALENGAVYDPSLLPSITGGADISLQDTISELGSIIEKIQSPVINVNVTTNVDKSGNATSKVDINSVSRDIARRASQYGQIAMAE